VPPSVVVTCGADSMVIPADAVERFERETGETCHAVGARVEVTDEATGTVRIGKVHALDQIAVDLGGGVVRAYGPSAVRAVGR
jgi:hypothetical protein